jgi:hypothetical protein
MAMMAEWLRLIAYALLLLSELFKGGGPHL